MTTTTTRGRQLNRPKPMTARYVYVESAGIIAVTVEHGNAQSFSRAVDPRAHKEAGRAWQELNNAGAAIRSVKCSDGAYGHHTPAGDDDTRTLSTLIYTVGR